MNQPRRLLGLFKTAQNSQPTSSSDVTAGLEAIETALSSLEPDEVLRLLGHVRDWNTSVRTAEVAQFVLYLILRNYAAEEILALKPPKRDAEEGNDEDGAKPRGRSPPSIGELLEGLLPYTERHFGRADRVLAQESFVIDYTLR